MPSRDERWHAFVDAYDIEVPEEAIQNELEYIKLDMRHRMQCEHMSGGEAHFFPEWELAEQADGLRAAAIFEAKEPRVLWAIIKEQGLSATPKELEAEAEALAEREHATMDMIKTFFGEDLSGLERDVLNRKAIDWAVGCED